MGHEEKDEDEDEDDEPLREEERLTVHAPTAGHACRLRIADCAACRNFWPAVTEDMAKPAEW